MSDYLLDHFWPIPLLVVGAIFLILVGARQIDHHYTIINCTKQAEAYNRQTKFAEYNYWNYECLVKTKNGSYAPLNNLYNNVQE